ncbi:MAG: hypothetical protein AB7U49_16490, partial [Hyphomicrobiaceae bacterium]
MSDLEHRRNEDERQRRGGVVVAYRWWERIGWLRWLFAHGGENAGRLAAALVILGVGTWTAWDAYDARRRGKFLRPVISAERLSNATFAYVIQGADSEGRRADFDLIVASKDYTWKRGATDTLERRGEVLSAAEVGKVIFDDLVRARLGAAKEIIAVGTASSEGDATQETFRAAKRAEQTAKWMTGSVSDHTPLWTLNLGQYNDPCVACDNNETDWQRPFIIVAVRRAAWGVDLAEALADALS